MVVLLGCCGGDVVVVVLVRSYDGHGCSDDGTGVVC